MRAQELSVVLKIMGNSLLEAARALERLEPIPDSQSSPPSSGTAPVKRKRGRPRKIVEAEPAPEPIATGSIGSDLVTHELCGRQIPSDALGIHTINCENAAAGYFDRTRNRTP